MEASEDFIPPQATRPGAGLLLAIPRLSPVPREADDVDCALETALALLRSCTGTAVPDAALFGVTEASDFAGRVEELSRVVDFLQLVAAGAVDRTRSQAAAGARTAAAKFGTDAPAGWLTGWNHRTEYFGWLPRRARPGTGRRARILHRNGWTTDTGTPQISCGRGCGSAPRKPGAGSPSPRTFCRAPACQASPCPPRGRSSLRVLPPGTSPHVRRRSSACPSTGSGTCPRPTMPPGWSMPSPGRRPRTTRTS